MKAKKRELEEIERRKKNKIEQNGSESTPKGMPIGLRPVENGEKKKIFELKKLKTKLDLGGFSNKIGTSLV